MASALHVHEFGRPDGYPLLALHGVTGHGGRWKALGEQHLGGFWVLAPDLRGHGRSDPHPPWTLEQHAADLLTLIDEYRLSACAVLGHSFGGAIALHLEHLAPQRITKLLLLDPVVGVDPELALEHAELPERYFERRADAVAAQRYEWPDVPAATIEDELLANLVETEYGWTFRYRQAAVAAAWSEMARAAVLPLAGIPTLLAPALRANYVRPEFVQGCRIVLQDNLTLTYVDGGHMLYLERPEEIARMVTAFVLGGGH
jgi:lipase